MVKEFRLSAILTSAIMIIIGCVLCAKPKMSIKVVCYAVAAAFLIFAVTRLFGYLRFRHDSGAKAIGDLVVAIFVTVLAIFFFLRPDTIAQIIPVVLGLIILVDGIVLFISGIAFHSFLPKSGLLSLLIGALNIILGCLAITNVFTTQVVLMEFIGASLVIAGIANIGNQIMIERADSKKTAANTVSFTTETTDADGTEGAKTKEPKKTE